jgi:hypothetical protein
MVVAGRAVGPWPGRFFIPERFKKYCSHSAEWNKGAVFLSFSFVSAQLQTATGMLLRQSLAKTQKSSLRMATLFLKALSCIQKAPAFVCIHESFKSTRICSINH